MATVLAFERHPVASESVEGFIELLSGLLDAMRSAPGALWADAARAGDDDPSWLVLSEWRTGADLDAWESSLPAAEFSQAADALLRGDITRRHFGSQA
ncbi:MAG: antibiotic biosynthesis monooxygenase [Actinomycetota bacterium]